ncbi:unnamed protein product, partial [Polarella glacialis]
ASYVRGAAAALLKQRPPGRAFLESLHGPGPGQGGHLADSEMGASSCLPGDPDGAFLEPQSSAAAAAALAAALAATRRRRFQVRAALCRLPGVGPKVADCVALFALGQHDCVPVDVHVWRIATRDYEPALRRAKSLTPAVYEQVGDAFRSRFGHFAGWAHSLLFGAELAGPLRSRLPGALLADMDSF